MFYNMCGIKGFNLPFLCGGGPFIYEFNLFSLRQISSSSSSPSRFPVELLPFSHKEFLPKSRGRRLACADDFCALLGKIGLSFQKAKFNRLRRELPRLVIVVVIAIVIGFTKLSISAPLIAIATTITKIIKNTISYTIELKGMLSQAEGLTFHSLGQRPRKRE